MLNNIDTEKAPMSLEAEITYTTFKIGTNFKTGIIHLPTL